VPLYDYRCTCGRVTESRQGIDTSAIPCPCGSSADRVQVYAPMIDLDKAPRESAIRRQRQEHRDFAEAREEVGTTYGSRRSNGDPVPRRDYLGEAKAAARRKGAAIR